MKNKRHLVFKIIGLFVVVDPRHYSKPMPLVVIWVSKTKVGPSGRY